MDFGVLNWMYSKSSESLVVKLLRSAGIAAPPSFASASRFGEAVILASNKSIDGLPGLDLYDPGGAVVASVNGGTSSRGSRQVISTGEKDDEVTEPGAVTVFAGAGKDKVTVGAKSGVNAGAGDDVVHAREESLIVDTSGNDYLTAGARSMIFGGDGNDMIAAGRDGRLHGGKGNDDIYAMGGSHVFGEDGNDRIVVMDEGDAPEITVVGGIGADSLVMAEEVTTKVMFYRGDGADTITGYTGKMSLNFGADIRPTDIEVEKRRGEDGIERLMFSIKGSFDSVTILDSKNVSDFTVVYGDGSTESFNSIRDRAKDGTVRR